MKVQKHVNIPIRAFWYRCKSVVFEQGLAKWELRRTGRYGLLEAYSQKPHRQLIDACDDRALQAFVKAWGPLNSFPLKAWKGNDFIASYHRERDILRAWVRFLAAIESPEHLQTSMHGLLRLFDKGDFIWLRGRLGIGDLGAGFDWDLEKRLDSATESELGDVCDYLAGIFPLHPSRHFDIDRTGRKPILRASSGVSSLTNALYWMVWQDIFMESPWQICEECHRLFQPDFRHKKKFCLPECAHRKAARESARRKRDKEKKAQCHS